MKLHISHRLTGFVLLCLLPSTLLRAAPSVSVALTANGSAIQGSGTAPYNAGLIDGLGFDHEIVVGRDAATGLPTGRRQAQAHPHRQTDR